MSASLFPVGPAHLFIKQRGQTVFYYLGTAVTAPELVTEKIKSPVNTHLLGPVPINSIYHSEVHTVTAVLNIFDWTVYNRLRGRYDPGVAGLRRGDWLDWVGNLTVPVEDFELLVLFDPPHASKGLTGRLYFSAQPLRFRETTENNRVIELGVVIECTPLFVTMPTPKQDVQEEDIFNTQSPSSTSLSSKPISTWLSQSTFAFSIAASVVNGVTNEFDPFFFPSNRPRQADPTKPSTVTVKNAFAAQQMQGNQLVANAPSASPIPTDPKAFLLYSEFPADWTN